MPAVLTDYEKQVGSSWLQTFKALNSLQGNPTDSIVTPLSGLVTEKGKGKLSSADQLTQLFKDCKTIGNYIINKKWPTNTDNFDEAFENIANKYEFVNTATSEISSLSGEQLARVIAKFCNKKNIIWSIPRYFSTFQLDDFTNNTFFGKALKEFGCIEGIDPDANTAVNTNSAHPDVDYSVKQNDPDTQAQASTPDPAASQPQQAPAQPAPDPQPQMNIPDPFANAPTANNYGANTTAPNSPVSNSGKPVSAFKSQGSLVSSQNIRDIKNNRKEPMKDCYKIVDKANTKATNGKTEFRVFVNPFTISYKGKIKGGITDPQGNLTNVVRLGSSKDYIDCVCYFKDKNAAETFKNLVEQDLNANKIIITKRGPGTLQVPDLEVQRCKSSKSGYFEIGTVYGNTYIVAPKANESLETEENE